METHRKILLLSQSKTSLNLAYAIDAAAVEKTGNEPPTAFRIWRAGENKYDGGVVYFTRNSAALLEAEQTSRNRPYVFDYNHLSLLSENPDSMRAAGWHRLEFRLDEAGEPECWVTACEWVESVARGMSQAVPEWRFFSPAFKVDPETNEVVGYTNCAITNNPLTHDLPMLASEQVNKEPSPAQGSRSNALDPKTALSILADPNASPEDRQAALDCLAALVAAGEPAPASEPAPAAAAAAEPPPAQAEDERASVALAVQHTALQKRVDELEVKDLLNGKVLPPSVRLWCMKQKPAVVKNFLSEATDFKPLPTATRPETPTQGSSAGSGFVAPPVGESPVDRVLGLTLPTSGRPGASNPPVNGVRKINHVAPSALRKGGT